MRGRASSFWFAGAAVVVAAVVVAWWLASGSPELPDLLATRRNPPEAIQTKPDTAPRRGAREQHGSAAAPAGADPGATPEAAAGAGPAEADEDDMAAMAWASVDLEAVRQAMPDNLYWKMAAPTNDPEVVKWRADERARWNVEFGKVLSGTATEEEIDHYYDHRARLSGDYVEFTTYLLDHYADRLPERDVALLRLARRMHLARLEEIPRKVEEALQRKQKQDAARAAWLADQAQFGAPDTGNQ
jgi:hypothetical protein